MLRRLWLLVLLVVLLTGVPHTSLGDAPTALSLRVGDTMVLGHYEQDGQLSNGKEPVEWYVINVDSEENSALLFSIRVLDMERYHKSWTNVNWTDCSVRAWLNSTFLPNCFSMEEQQVILVSRLYSNYVDCQTITDDMVFLLDSYDYQRYLRKKAFRKARPTAYAESQEVVNSKGYSYWWLRDTTQRKSDANRVDPEGNLQDYGANTNAYGVGIRPAIRIDLDRYAWLSDHLWEDKAESPDEVQWTLHPTISVVVDGMRTPLDVQLICSYDGMTMADGIGMFVPLVELLNAHADDYPILSGKQVEIKAYAEAPIVSLTTSVLTRDEENTENGWKELGFYNEALWRQLQPGKYLLHTKVRTKYKEYYYSGMSFVWVQKPYE